MQARNVALSTAAVETLFDLAREAEASGRPAKSIKCMLAVLAADPLPDLRVRAALDLSRLYVDHTSNIKQAKDVTHKLLLFIKSQPERTQDRCECYSRLTDIELASGCSDAALEACQLGMAALKAGPVKLADAQGWWLHFGCKAAASGIQGAQNWTLDVELALLNLASPSKRIALLVSDMHATVLLDESSAFVSKFQRLEVEHSSLSLELKGSDYIAELVLHQHFLHAHAIMSFSVDDPGKALEADSSDTLPTLLQSMRTLLSRLEGKKLQHAWLSLETQTGLAMAMQASYQINRFGCSEFLAPNASSTPPKGRTALYYISLGLKAVQSQIDGMQGLASGIDGRQRSSSEDQLLSTQLIHLNLKALSSMYHLTGTGGSDDGPQSFAACQSALASLQAYTTKCGHSALRHKCIVHLLTGTYSHMMNAWEDGLAHYSAALACCRGSGTNRAALQTLIATQQASLHLDSSAPDASNKAAAVLQAHADVLTASESSNKQAGLMSHISHASVHLSKAARGGESSDHEFEGARSHLSKALALAHNTVRNEQLTILTLTAFVPLQLQHRDEPGARDMCTTSLALSKHCGDGNLRILSMAAGIGMSFWDDKKAAFAAQKRADWSRRARVAIASPLHTQLLAWA